MGQNEQKKLEKFFEELLDMYEAKDVYDALTSALLARGVSVDKPALAPKKLTPLEELEQHYGLKMVPFRTGKIKKLVGVRRAPNGDRAYDHIFEVECNDHGECMVMRDGRSCADIQFIHTKKIAERVGLYIVRSLIKESRRRHDVRKRAKMRNAEGKGGEQ